MPIKNFIQIFIYKSYLKAIFPARVHNSVYNGLWRFKRLDAKITTIMERTFVMLKPGVLQRRIVGEVMHRFERKGLKIIAMKLVRLDKATVEAHYAEHKGKDFYEKLVDYTISGPVIIMVLEGEDAIIITRRLAGPTSYLESVPGTIRGDYAASTRYNIVHASDSQESAAREIALFFSPSEICSWEDGNAQWLMPNK
jgi:nucleoside-diphosphate kinase